MKDEAPGKPETSFRLVPGLHGRMWIYQGDDDEAVTLWEGGIWDGYACRWPPLHGLNDGVGGYQKTGQVFRLEAARNISPEEQRIPKARQPSWSQYTWWGAPPSLG